MPGKSNVFILSAPSGAGKSTLIQLLFEEISGLHFSISHTTRPPREGETDGVEYFFVNEPRFRKMIESNQFLEWAHVHGYFYGTSLQMIQLAEEQGKDLLLDINIQGAAKVRKRLPDAISVFILPPSYEVLKRRLVERQTDSPGQIRQRIENARQEIEHYAEYDYIILNEDLGAACQNLASIIRSHRCREKAQAARIEEILRSFQE